MVQPTEVIDAAAYAKFRTAAESLGLHAHLFDDERLRALFVAALRSASVEDTLTKLAKATNQVCSIVLDGLETPLGTGFLIGPNHVLTAAHVVRDPNARMICRFNNVTFAGSSVNSQAMLPVAVKRIGPTSPQPPDRSAVTLDLLDFAVLELEADAGADSRGFVALAPRRVDRGDEAYVVGHPGGGSQVVFSTGKITKEFDDPTDLVFFHSAPAGDGQSGAPVFNENFDVIGMHRAPGRAPNEGEAVSTSVILRVIGG